MSNTETLNIGNLMQRDAIKELLKIIMEEIKNNMVETIADLPIDIATEEEFPEEMKGKVPDAFAVFKAIKKINHIYLKFVKAEGEKTFEQMMEGETPQEMCFYVFKDSTTDDSFDLYFYDSQQGKYVNVGSTNVGSIGLDPSKYWSKEELNLDEVLANYWNKTELDITTMLEVYVKKADLNLDEYVRKDELTAITADDVRTMWTEVQNTGA